MSKQAVTQLLQKIGDGDVEASESLFPLIYEELRSIAHRELQRERSNHTLNTTALVHELYLKMVDKPPNVDWNGRGHFFAIAARGMRQILVNYAVARRAQKRGGGVSNVTLDEALLAPAERPEELIALDEALDRLAMMNERQAKVVELRYFAGLTIEETATALDVSAATVNRDWTTARLWLFSQVREALRQS